MLRRTPEWSSGTDFCMGTVFSQRAYGVNSRGAVRAALREVRRLEGLFSRFIESSDISRLNAAAVADHGRGARGVRVRPETLRVLEASLEISRLSGGAFDVTVAPLVALWAAGEVKTALPPDDAVKPSYKPPSDEAIAHARALVGYRSLTVDAASGFIRLASKGQMVDLGGIGKGFAADRVLEVYRRRGVVSGMVDLGGNVALLGGKPDGSPFTVGIQDPDAARGECLGFLPLKDVSAVTSGDYERYLEVSGKRYSHIIDPRTGYPVESGLRSVTVIARESMIADGLSTALFVLGLERGLELLRALREASRTLHDYRSVEAVFVTHTRAVHLTPGIADVYTPLVPLSVTSGWSIPAGII